MVAKNEKPMIKDFHVFSKMMKMSKITRNRSRTYLFMNLSYESKVPAEPLDVQLMLPLVKDALI